MRIKFELKNNKQLDRFMELVKDFEKANPHLRMRQLRIIFQYGMMSSGEFYDSSPNTIAINPNRCDITGEFSFFLICVHEWSHLIDRKFKMGKPFRKEFADSKLFLTNYAKREKSKDEELAEIISLYLRNPYLLKLISEKHYKFVSRYFTSPVQCTKNVFLHQYELFSPRYRKHIFKNYGIVIEGSEIYKNDLLISA